MIRRFKHKTPKIASSAFVSEAAYVIGDVEIGENSSVWPGAVIRADMGRICIGSNTAIEDNVVIHAGSPSTPTGELVIGDHVLIGHGAVINGTKIGNHVLVGINATILHEAEIGDHCIIAAGSLVQDMMQIPNQSFVAGVPAQIKGKASPEQLRWVEQAPKAYLELMELYKKEGDTL